MPTTPAQLTEIIASAVATALTNQQPVNRDLFNTAASGSISNTSMGRKMKILEVIFLDQQLMKFLQIYRGKHHQLPTRLSSGVACQTPTQIIIIIILLKAAILFTLKSEDLLTLITKVRSKPIKTSLNPNGYSPRRCIFNIKGEEETINCDHEYLYRHGVNRLYLAMTICISNEIQY